MLGLRGNGVFVGLFGFSMRMRASVVGTVRGAILFNVITCIGKTGFGLHL